MRSTPSSRCASPTPPPQRRARTTGKFRLPPYRFLPDGPAYRHVEERIWERSNGFLSLSIAAGAAPLHPETQKWVNLPLPFGPKARLIQIHLDTQAKLHDKPVVELEGSMTSFINQLQGRSPNGPASPPITSQSVGGSGEKQTGEPQFTN
jgi:hypothetical protein